MKIKISSILHGVGKAVKVAGPVVAGLGLGGPVGAVATVAGQLMGAGAKKKGQAREKAVPGSAPLHKVGAPVASMSAAAAVLALLRWAGVEIPGEAMDALLVLIPWLTHNFGHSMQASAQPRNQPG